MAKPEKLLQKTSKKTEEKTLNDAQIKLMNNLKAMLPAHLSLVDTISQLFNISNDSAYRRIRGETPLTIEEIATLCRKFNFSFDNFINSGQTGIVNFFYKPIHPSFDGFKEYMTRLLGDLNNVNRFPEKEILFAGEDIPVFHHFTQPNLCAFKAFYWVKSILNSTELESKKFALSEVKSELIELCKNVHDSYSTIPSTEIWAEDTVNSTLLQIEFYWDSGLFDSKETALLVCDDFERMINHLQRQAELNRKFPYGNDPKDTTHNYTMYESDITIGNNYVLVKIGEVKTTYVSYHTLNTMLTNNATFCNETDLWIQSLIKKSTQISGISEKQRYRFFKRIYDKVNKLKEKIKSE